MNLCVSAANSLSESAACLVGSEHHDSEWRSLPLAIKNDASILTVVATALSDGN